MYGSVLWRLSSDEVEALDVFQMRGLRAISGVYPHPLPSGEWERPRNTFVRGLLSQFPLSVSWREAVLKFFGFLKEWGEEDLCCAAFSADFGGPALSNMRTWGAWVRDMAEHNRGMGEESPASFDPP